MFFRSYHSFGLSLGSSRRRCSRRSQIGRSGMSRRSMTGRLHRSDHTTRNSARSKSGQSKPHCNSQTRTALTCRFRHSRSALTCKRARRYHSSASRIADSRIFRRNRFVRTGTPFHTIRSYGNRFANSRRNRCSNSVRMPR